MIPMKPTPLSQLAVISAGQGAPKDNEFSESGVPFVRAGSLEALLSGKNESELELVSAETAKLRKLKTYPKGTILFAKSGMSATKDRVYVLQSPAHVVSHLATLIPKDGAHVDYLRLALKRFPPSSLIKDPAYPAIGLGEISSFEIPVPEEFNDQIRIAHLLGKVEGLIAQRKQHLLQLGDLLKSVFLEMFGDPAQNEKGWEQEPLGGLVSEKIGYGIVQPGNPVETGVPVIRVGDFIGTEISSSGITKVDEKISKKHRNSVLKGDEILLACVGATIGKVACVRQEHAGYNIVRATARIRPSNKVDRLFLLHYLLSGFSQNYYVKVTRAVGQPTLNIKQIEELPVTIPPLALQQEFSNLVERIGALKSRYQQSLTDLEALYGALSQQAFKGELDMSRVALPAAPIEGESPVAAVVPAPVTASLIELPETDLLLPALQDRTQLAPLLRCWLEAYRTQLGGVAFSLERFIAAAQSRLAELHPDNDFELRASDHEHVKAWVFEALDSGRLRQERNQVYCVIETRETVLGNLIELKASQT